MENPVLTTIFHFMTFAFLVRVYIFYEEIKLEVFRIRGHDPEKESELYFLTIWSLLFQLFYFCVCCVTDLIATSGSHSPVGQKLASFRDWFLAALAFPFGALVVIMFWSIYSVDRELIFPEVLDEVFPAWLNHALHTYVLPLLLIDMALIPHNYPSRLAGMSGTIAFGMGYLLWVLYLGFYQDIWVYPFFKVLDGIYFPLFFLVSGLGVGGLYLMGEKVNSFLGRFSRSSTTSQEKID